MTERVRKLRQQSLDARESLAAERAVPMTEFYRQDLGLISAPLRRALAFQYMLEHKPIYIGAGELIVGEKGPQALQDDQDLDKLVQLIRTYFRLGAHHIQFNVVDAATLRLAQEQPEQHHDLIVRVAGYSGYYCDLSRALQDEIIARTEYQGL